jgi:hypothetical protein
MSYAPIFNEEQTIDNGSPMTQYTGGVHVGPCVALISGRQASNNASIDFYMNDDSSTTTRVYVEATYQPFKVVVDDLSDLYFQAVSSDIVISIIAYPINTIVP